MGKSVAWLIGLVAVFVPTIVFAWDPTVESAPYECCQSIFWSYEPDYVTEDMKWSQDSLDDWEVIGPAWLDTTADCDELSAWTYHANIPNTGWGAYTTAAAVLISRNRN